MSDEDRESFVESTRDSGPTFLEDYPEHARLIGCLIAEWTAIEYKLMWLASFRMGVNARVVQPMIYGIDSSNARLESLRGAFMAIHNKSEAMRSEMEATLSESKQLLTQRNKYAHAIYGENTKTKEL